MTIEVTQANQALKAALAHYRKTALLNSVGSVAHWDTEVYMPEGGAEIRGEQLGVMAGFIHQLKTDSKYVDLVFGLSEDNYSAPVDKTQVKLLKKDLLRMRSLPEKLIVRSAELKTAANQNWIKARSEKNFNLVKNDLKELIAIEQEVAQRWKEDTNLKKYYSGKSLYEILVDQYEPEFPIAKMRSLLANLAEETRIILPLILEKSRAKYSMASFAKSEAWQYEFSKKTIEAMGFNLKRGRLDKSVHPFCSNVQSDVRLTIRYNMQDYSDCLGSAMHEAGHGIYEQNLPKELYFTPAGETTSLGVHESQSRFWENMIGRSLAFCNWFSKVAEVPAQDLYARLNHVEPSFIRTESDEVTYNLHIYIRMLIEEQLIEGKLNVDSVVDIWNENYHKYLGIEVTDPSVGILQDMHWFNGAFGYFPTYSLGNIFSAALMQRLEKEHSNWQEKVEKGEFQFIREFLTTNVHNKASTISGYDIMKQVSSAEPSEQPLMNYFKNKYLGNK